MPVLAIVPARGGSRGLPRKHLRLLGGQPLIAHTIRAALAAKRIDRVIVSTDDPAIARAARRAGAEVPFMRPPELARDDTPTFPVIEHALGWTDEHGPIHEIVVTLLPTSPLRGAELIDAVVTRLDDPNVVAATTVAEIPYPTNVLGHLEGMRLSRYPVSPQADPRRQAVPWAVRLTGAVYATRRELIASGRLLDDAPDTVLTDGAAAIDIDDLADLLEARRWLHRGPARQ